MTSTHAQERFATTESEPLPRRISTPNPGSRAGTSSAESAGPLGAPPRDLVDRADVEALLQRFYGRALADEILAAPFVEIRSRGLEAHLPVMCDFWETVLFRAGLYRRNAFQAHRYVHGRTPLSAKHFRRWLTLWNTTIDEMFRGPVAEHAKIQAARIASSMHRRLTGSDLTALEARSGQHLARRRVGQSPS